MKCVHVAVFCRDPSGNRSTDPFLPQTVFLPGDRDLWVAVSFLVGIEAVHPRDNTDDKQQKLAVKTAVARVKAI